MILFIFEGASYEPPLYDGIKSLFFPKSVDQVICSFCSSIYTFYKRLKDDFDGFADVVDVLKTELLKTDPGSELFKYKSSDFESIYLFFDYDFYRGDLTQKNAQVRELLAFFNEETENGRLFISYPMIESIQYTKELPDAYFHKYTVQRDNSVGEKFKREARQFCYYKGYAFLKDYNNWIHIVRQSVFKASNIINGSLIWPFDKDDIDQMHIFNAQVEKYVVPYNEVAILNAFPLFLFYYFPIEKFNSNLDNESIIK